jgi:hypothetical protein
MAAMFQVKVNNSWVDLPDPSEWTWSYKDLSSDNSGRSLDGTMHKDLVSVKRTNNLVWWGKDNTTASTLMQAAKSAVFVPLKYTDPFDNASKTITVYSGDITCQAQMAQGHYVWQVSLNFIEQ